MTDPQHLTLTAAEATEAAERRLESVWRRMEPQPERQGVLIMRRIKPPLRVGEPVALVGPRRRGFESRAEFGTPILASAVPEQNEKGVWGWRYTFK